MSSQSENSCAADFLTFPASSTDAWLCPPCSIPLCFLDVNAVPGKLVYSSGIRVGGRLEQLPPSAHTYRGRKALKRPCHHLSFVSPASEAQACLLQKMPTIVVYKDGEKVAEHIAAEGGPDAVDKVRGCILCWALPEQQWQVQ